MYILNNTQAIVFTRKELNSVGCKLNEVKETDTLHEGT